MLTGSHNNCVHERNEFCVNEHASSVGRTTYSFYSLKAFCWESLQIPNIQRMYTFGKVCKMINIYFVFTIKILIFEKRPANEQGSGARKIEREWEKDGLENSLNFLLYFLMSVFISRCYWFCFSISFSICLCLSCYCYFPFGWDSWDGILTDVVELESLIWSILRSSLREGFLNIWWVELTLRLPNVWIYNLCCNAFSYPFILMESVFGFVFEQKLKQMKYTSNHAE